MEYISDEEDRELVKNCDKLQRKWEEEQIKNLKIINESIMEELGNKKPRGFMQSCFPMSVYFKCLSEFLLYFYKCSTSMAFT